MLKSRRSRWTHCANVFWLYFSIKQNQASCKYLMKVFIKHKANISLFRRVDYAGSRYVGIWEGLVHWKDTHSSKLYGVHLSLPKFPSVLSLTSFNLFSSRVPYITLSLKGTGMVGQPSDEQQVRNDINSLALTSAYRWGRRREDDPGVQTIGPGTTAGYFPELDSKIQ